MTALTTDDLLEAAASTHRNMDPLELLEAAENGVLDELETEPLIVLHTDLDPRRHDVNDWAEKHDIDHVDKHQVISRFVELERAQPFVRTPHTKRC